jgi:hypothetical protein
MIQKIVIAVNKTMTEDGSAITIRQGFVRGGTTADFTIQVANIK